MLRRCRRDTNETEVDVRGCNTAAADVHVNQMIGSGRVRRDVGGGGGGRGAACAQKGSSGSPGWIELVAGFISSVCMGECVCANGHQTSTILPHDLITQ